MSETGPAPAGKRFLIAGVLAVAAAAVVLIGLSVNRGREIEKERQSRRAEVKAGPRVPVATASRAPTKRSVTLNGEAHPYATVTLYAKVSGYLREIRVDKGDRVARGDLLAVIESPELDRQYDAAVADAKNKRIFAERERQLLKDGVVAEQDADNAVAAARVAEATAASLRSQKGYETIRAPFAGTVTARFVDPGTLLQSATTAQTSAQPLLTLSSTERLRIYVYLDQKNAALVKAGDRAVIADAVRPEARVEAKVSRMSDELDVKTRTRLVELDLDNRKGVFLAGGFVQVSLVLHAPPYVQVPVAALLMRGEKAFVGTVDGDNRVTFRPVET
ncbi:MAG TPA: efflux RND transporter periplasmic adaptor subunit, partial [Geobacteraceae bacterium]